MAKSDSDPRGTSGSRAVGSSPAAGPLGPRRSRRDTSGRDATTGTIPSYGANFPDPDFDVSARAAVSAAGGVVVDDPARAGRAAPSPSPGPGSDKRARPRRTRRAQLQLRHINPWTVLRFSCVLAIALFFVWMIVVGVLYGVLDAAGALEKINNAITTIKGDGSKPPIRATIVFGGAAIIGVANMILFIALSTVGSVVYNLCADLVGGIEVTLSEA